MPKERIGIRIISQSHSLLMQPNILDFPSSIYNQSINAEGKRIYRYLLKATTWRMRNNKPCAACCRYPFPNKNSAKAP